MTNAHNGRLTLVRRRVERRVMRLLERHGYYLTILSDDDRRYLAQAADPRTPLPPDAESYLINSNPRLQQLRARYRELALPVTQHTRWAADRITRWLDLQYFRGETLFLWHYRETPQLTGLKYLVFGEYLRDHDPHSLISVLGEDGAFGCWSFDFGDRGRYSRDLLDSVNEITFLDRHFGVLSGRPLRVLDIGAGYGRLAHRLVQCASGISDYCCVDAIPEATFLCEYYLRYRHALPPARVVALDEVHRDLRPSSFDIAVNIHSFSECTYAAVEWWLQLVSDLSIPYLMIVPNDSDRLLTWEADGARVDFAPLLAAWGYKLEVSEPAIDDPVLRRLLRLPDRFLLFTR